MRVSGRFKRRDGTAYLFPGITLSNQVHKTQFVAQIVGDTFEKLTHAVVGASWKRLVTETDMDLSPDLLNSNTKTYIESKATQRRHYFKVAWEQLCEYERLVRTYAALQENYQVLYYLWTYNATDLAKEGKTVGGVIQRVLDSVECLDIVHWSVLKRVYEIRPEFCAYREYKSWRNNRGGNFRVLQVGHPFLATLRYFPEAVLTDVLKLKAENYVVRSPNRFVRGLEIDCEGVKFRVKNFPVFSFTRPKGFVEFPELVKPDDGIPF